MGRSFSEDLNDTHLFEAYMPGEYRYEWNEIGGKSATGVLQFSNNPIRDSHAQATAGGLARRQGGHEWGEDDGGHLIAARFGGSPGPENLTAQNRNLNRGSYKRMENEWAAHLEAGDKVFVHLETSEGERPDAYMGYAIYESPDRSRDYAFYYFENESNTQQAQWEAELTTLEQEAPVGFQNEDGYYYIGIAEPSTHSEAVNDQPYLGNIPAVQDGERNEKHTAEEGQSLEGDQMEGEIL